MNKKTLNKVFQNRMGLLFCSLIRTNQEIGMKVHEVKY